MRRSIRHWLWVLDLTLDFIVVATALFGELGIVIPADVLGRRFPWPATAVGGRGLRPRADHDRLHRRRRRLSAGSAYRDACPGRALPARAASRCLRRRLDGSAVAVLCFVPSLGLLLTRWEELTPILEMHAPDRPAADSRDGADRDVCAGAAGRAAVRRGAHQRGGARPADRRRRGALALGSGAVAGLPSPRRSVLLVTILLGLPVGFALLFATALFLYAVNPAAMVALPQTMVDGVCASCCWPCRSSSSPGSSWRRAGSRAGWCCSSRHWWGGCAAGCCRWSWSPCLWSRECPARRRPMSLRWAW